MSLQETTREVIKKENPFMSLRNDQRFALHEAAHVVTALHFGFNVPNVTIIYDGRYAAQTEVETPAYGDEGKDNYLPVIYHDALVDLAGVIVNTYQNEEDRYHTIDFRNATEKLAFYWAATRDLIEPSDYWMLDDNRLTEELFEYFALEDDWSKASFDELWAQAVADAKRFVDEHQHCIIVVGQKLAHRKHLNEQALRKIIKIAMK